MLPGVFPCAIILGVADLVVGNGIPVKRRQLILPPRIAVGICVALSWCQPADGACCVHIRLLCQDIPAQIIGENPGRAGAVRRGVGLVINPRQLADGVILVLRGQAAGVDLLDVPVVVVGVGQDNAALGDLLDQPGGAVGAGQGGFLMVGMGSPAFLACCGLSEPSAVSAVGEVCRRSTGIA